MTTNKILDMLGLEVRRKNKLNFDIKNNTDFMEMYNFCKPYTMLPIERMYSLYNATHYIFENKIEGDLVECGVWKGGACMLMGIMMKEYESNRKIWMYDTFTGMTKPNDEEFDVSINKKCGELYAKNKNWCRSEFKELMSNMKSAIGEVGLDNNLVVLEGDVCTDLDTDENLPKEISLLRLDTDFYKSTRKELEILYPKLVSGGVLIVDDYGQFSGAKKAVDEYFIKNGIKMLLNRVDYSCVVGVRA